MNLLNRKSLLITMTTGSLVAAKAMAFIAPANPAVQIKTSALRPLTYKPTHSLYSADKVLREYDQQSNAIRAMMGRKIFGIKLPHTAQKVDFENAALKAVALNPEIFGVDAHDVVLNPKATLLSGDNAAVTFHVYRGGVRIQDAVITFQFKQGSLILVKNESYAEAVVTASGSLNTRDLAAAAVGSTVPPVPRKSIYRVKPTDAGYSLVRVDEFAASRDNNAYVVQIDATTGDVFDIRTKNFHLSGVATGKVYPRYFREQLTDVTLPFAKASNAAGIADEQGEFQTIDERAPFMQGLQGQFVNVKDLGGRNLLATGVTRNGKWLINFDVKPNEDKPWDNGDAAQTMVYVNANKIINQAKKFISPDWFKQPLQTNVNLSDHCNAFWNEEDGTLNFFSAGSVKPSSDHEITCANTGTISDVVFHEWGHGLDENTGGIDDGALSEGFGDALAMYMTSDPKVGIDFMPLTHQEVRNISELKVYPKDLTFEVHDDGMIIGGTWYDLYKALHATKTPSQAKELMGRYLFQGIYSFTKMSDVYKVTLALDDDNGDLTDGTPNFCLINAAFARHGLAKEEASCKE